jgi:hypothetical protein
MTNNQDRTNAMTIVPIVGIGATLLLGCLILLSAALKIGPPGLIFFPTILAQFVTCIWSFVLLASPNRPTQFGAQILLVLGFMLPLVAIIIMCGGLYNAASQWHFGN